jgi:serine/threonine-protein kinase
VAIKVLRPDLAEDEEFLARFRREAKAVAGLRHASIIRVFDFDVWEGVYYMVTELLEGETLRARLNGYRTREERMPLGDTARIVLDVVDGLCYAHGEGMIHRDIKPANIMLTQRGQTVLVDFGIAQIIGGTRHTLAGALMGTLNYIAPEQGLEGRCDPRSDIYSLGIVFYEMLTQSTPFDADTPLAVLMKHLHDPLPLPREVDPSIPPAIERIVVKCLAKSPEDRYPDAEAMGLALRQAVDEAEIELPAQVARSPWLDAEEATHGSVPGSAAVLSGADRGKFLDPHLATDDTDAIPRGRQAASEKRTAPWRLAWPALTTGRSIIAAVVLVVVCNLALVWLGGLSGRWEIFDRGWPIELISASMGLGVILYATSSIWLLIPIAILLGNGVILAYCAVTGNWHHWLYLWPLELLLVPGSIGLTIWLAKQRALSRQMSRPLGCAVGLMSAIWCALLILASLARSVFG